MLAEDRPKAFTATQVYIVQDSSLTVVISRMLWLVAVSLVVVMLYPLISSPWVILKVLFFLSLHVHEKDGPGFPRDTQINLAFSSTLAWNFRLPYIPGGSENKNGGNKKKNEFEDPTFQRGGNDCLFAINDRIYLPLKKRIWKHSALLCVRKCVPTQAYKSQ